MVKKWEDKDDKDLMFAVILSMKGSGSIQVSWDKVKKLMTSWGHGFSESAMSQHFQKRLLKDFKDAKGPNFDAALGDTDTGKGATGRKRKAPATKAPAAADDHSDDVDSEDAATPAKKAKIAPKKKATAGKKKDVAMDQPAEDNDIPELSDIPELDEDVSGIDEDDEDNCLDHLNPDDF